MFPIGAHTKTRAQHIRTHPAGHTGQCKLSTLGNTSSTSSLLLLLSDHGESPLGECTCVRTHRGNMDTPVTGLGLALSLRSSWPQTLGPPSCQHVAHEPLWSHSSRRYSYPLANMWTHSLWIPPGRGLGLCIYPAAGPQRLLPPFTSCTNTHTQTGISPAVGLDSQFLQ